MSQPVKTQNSCILIFDILIVSQKVLQKIFYEKNHLEISRKKSSDAFFKGDHQFGTYVTFSEN